MGRVLPSVLAALLATAAFADDGAVRPVQPTLQTPYLTEADQDADADDPAIWVHPADATNSLVITAVKNGGIRVYDLKAGLVQAIGPEPEGTRINNVDLVYGFALSDGTSADLVVASDRGRDFIRIWKIDPETPAAPLTEITAPDAARAFPARLARDGVTTEENPVDDQETVYGLAAWTDAASGVTWVAGTQRHQTLVGLFRLEARPGGTVAAVIDHAFTVPAEHRGQSLWEESDEDPAKDWSPQFEGLVIDRTDGRLYAGQEDVGIWAIPVADAGAAPVLVYETRGAEGSPFRNEDSAISRDVEGLTIYYAATGTRYLLASSQGGAHGEDGRPDAPYDDSFVVFDLAGDAPALLGSFRVEAHGDIDAVQESDGADVISLGLPGFPDGLFVTQDGYAGDLNGLDGEVDSTGFKFVDWRAIASAFEPPLEITPAGFDPRK